VGHTVHSPQSESTTTLYHVNRLTRHHEKYLTCNTEQRAEKIPTAM